MNKFLAIGRWSQEITLRYTQSGKAVASTTLAINEGYGDKKTTTFIPVVIWGKTAEVAAQYTDKGTQVGIEGRMQVREWEKDGSKRYTTEIVVERLELLGGNKKAEDGPPMEPKYSDPFAGSTSISIPDDDLPFIPNKI